MSPEKIHPNKKKSSTPGVAKYDITMSEK